MAVVGLWLFSWVIELVLYQPGHAYLIHIFLLLWCFTTGFYIWVEMDRREQVQAWFAEHGSGK